MKFYEYIPNFVSGLDPEVFELSTIEDFRNSVTCRRCEKSKGFSKFLVEPYDNKTMVRAEFLNGEKWIVGFIV